MSGNRRNFIENLIISGVVFVICVVIYMIIGGANLSVSIDINKYTKPIYTMITNTFKDTRVQQIITKDQNSTDNNSTAKTSEN